MNKRRTIFLLGLIVIIAGWWTLLRDSSKAAPAEGVVDVWVTWGEPADQLQALFDRFSQASGVPVRVSTQVRSDELRERLEGSEPPDLVLLSTGDLVRSYQQQALLQPLEAAVAGAGIDLEDIYPAALAQCQTADGQLLCLPWGADVDALFWNKELFAAAGLDPERPPQTMEEMLAYAERLTLRDEAGELTQVGFIPDFPRSHLEQYARSFGGTLADGERSLLSVNSQAVVAALDWQSQFYDLYTPAELKAFVSSFTPYMTSSHPVYAGRRLSCQQCHRSTPLQNGKTPDVGFLEGRVAMLFDGAWQLNPALGSGEEAAASYGMAALPPTGGQARAAGSTIVEGPVFILPTGAVDRAAVVALLAWAMSPEIVADAAYAHATLPSNREAAQDARFQESPGFPLLTELLSEPGGTPRTSLISSEAFNEGLGEAERKVLHEEAQPGPLLEALQRELTAGLQAGLAAKEQP